MFGFFENAKRAVTDKLCKSIASLKGAVDFVREHPTQMTLFALWAMIQTVKTAQECYMAYCCFAGPNYSFGIALTPKITQIPTNLTDFCLKTVNNTINPLPPLITVGIFECNATVPICNSTLLACQSEALPKLGK